MKAEGKSSASLDKCLFKELLDANFLIKEDLIIDCNEAAIKMFGYESKKELIGLKPSELSPAMQLDGRYFRKEDRKMITMALKNGSHRFEWIHTRKNGEEFFAEVVLVKTSMEGKQIISALIKDITEQKKMQKLVKENENMYRRLFEENHNITLLIDPETGDIMDANSAACFYYGYNKDELMSLKITDINISAKEKILQEMEKAKFAKNKSFNFKHRLSNGEIRDVEVYSGPIKINNKEILYSMIHDITENKKKEEKIQHLAFRDSLTGLYNRAFFIDKLNDEIFKAHRKKEKLAILYMDLDDFKKINDTLGHFIGDKLLQVIAKRLNQCTRKCDIVARLGGDEFIFLLPEMNHVENAVDIAERIMNIFKKPFIIDNYELYICISIGIALYPDNGLDANTLMVNSDIAMYQAKETKGDTIEIFTPILNEKINEEFVLENNLYHALDRNEFLLYYQPIMDIDTGQIIAAEALLRWKNPKLGFLPPDKFIPIAENNNSILRIGEWVLRTACEQNKKWQDAGYTPIFIAVNISVKQLQQKNFADLVEKILIETGLEAKYLELEITESISAENISAISDVLRKINNLGVKLSIDDFGTGYSSLGQLKKLAVNKLKIDKSFIDDINEDMDNTAIVSAIIAMATTLNIDVVAEGIETTKQLEFLKEEKCDMGQGYLFSRPIDSDLFEKSLLQNFSYKEYASSLGYVENLV